MNDDPTYDNGSLCNSVPFDEDSVFRAIDGETDASTEVSDREGQTIIKVLEFLSERTTPSGAVAGILAVTNVLAPWLLDGKSLARMARESGMTKQNVAQSVKAWNERTGIRGRLQRSEAGCEAMSDSYRRRKKAAGTSGSLMNKEKTNTDGGQVNYGGAD